MHSTNPASRGALIDGLRAMADYLEANPELPTPSGDGSQIFVSIDGTDDHKRAEITRLAGLLDVTPTWGEHYRAIRSFGPLTYRAVAIPQAAGPNTTPAAATTPTSKPPPEQPTPTKGPPNMRIRIEGTRTEITDSVLALRDLYVVTHVSRPRPARRRIYRVTVDAYKPAGS